MLEEIAEFHTKLYKTTFNRDIGLFSKLISDRESSSVINIRGVS